METIQGDWPENSRTWQRAEVYDTFALSGTTKAEETLQIKTLFSFEKTERWAKHIGKRQWWSVIIDSGTIQFERNASTLVKKIGRRKSGLVQRNTAV